VRLQYLSELQATDAFLTIGPRADSRIDTALSPPSGFIATAMDFRMTAAAERDGELIADLAAECRWLHESEMVASAGRRPQIRQAYLATDLTCPRSRMRRAAGNVSKLLLITPDLRCFRISTGPKSRAGKWRSARNARRHGLSLSIWSDPSLSADAEALVLALAGPAASPEFQCRVRAAAAAAAHIDVNRIRRVRHHLIAQEFDGPNLGLTTSQASRKFLRDLMRLEVVTSRSLHLRSLLQFLQTADRAQKFALAITNLARQLAILERYERRALSQRK